MLSSLAFGSNTTSSLKCSTVVSQDQFIKELAKRDNIDDINPPATKEFVSAAQAVVGTIEGVYGPIVMKDESIGLDWNKAVSRLFGKIGQVDNPKEFIFEIANFIFQLKDSHVAVTLPSSLSWKLPFQLTYSVSENVYFINYLVPEKLFGAIKSGPMPPLGSELLKVNGQSVHEFQKSPYFNDAANEITAKGLFARQLTNLNESSGIPLSLFPDRTWTFTFLFPDGKIHDVKMEYEDSGVGLLSLDTVLPVLTKTERETLNEQIQFNLSNLTYNPKFARIEKLIQDSNALLDLRKKKTSTETDEVSEKSIGRPYRIGLRKPNYKLPENFKPIELPAFASHMAGGGHLLAGTFEYKGKRIGFLRIPSYGPKVIEMAPIELNYLIHKLEKESDVLILDQLDNPGGYVIYVDWIAKAFVGEIDLKRHLKFQLKPTHNYLQDFAELTQDLDAAASTPQEKALAQRVRDQFEILHRAYRSGDPVSEPITWTATSEIVLAQLMVAHKESGTLDMFKAFTGVDVSVPKVYTKPVYMLINHFDFSGGDATPAILQDYKRVTLIGQRTAGAGGPVREFQENKRALEMQYTLTTGLMYRPTHKNPYVENYGVKPDVELNMTKDDLLDGDTYLNKVLQLIK